MKRYAIVRVDNHCPEGLYENIKPNTLCPKDGDCEKCKYGDTKGQLIKKIETAVAIMRNKMTNKEVYLDRAVATFIVEFLGVEE